MGKAIARRVAAEALYAAQHAKMIVAQKKSHKLRLAANRYRKMVAHHNKMTKKFNAGTKFHKGKEAHWKRLAAAARHLAKKYIRHAKEEHKFHYLRLAGQADRKAAREWARHNRHIKEMKYAIKKMIASVAHRKRVVKKSMTFVTKQNALMQKANKA